MLATTDDPIAATKSPALRIEPMTGYTVVDYLGGGTFGNVYRVFFNDDLRTYALKMFYDPPPDEDDDADYDEPTRREVDILRTLATRPHDNIVRLFDLRDTALPRYVVLDLYDHDLYDYVRRDRARRCTAWFARKCALQLLRGLAHLHAMHIMHRDIKPQNVLITRDGGRLALADFGLGVRYADGLGERTYTLNVVTVDYRPIELLLGRDRYDERIDVWSTGCVLGFLGLPSQRATAEGPWSLHTFFGCMPSDDGGAAGASAKTRRTLQDIDVLDNICRIVGAPKESDGLSHLAVPMGRKWRKCTGTPPPGGIPLCNRRLSAALGVKREFTHDEWKAFHVGANLTREHYVQVGDGTYFIPVAVPSAGEYPTLAKPAAIEWYSDAVPQLDEPTAHLARWMLTYNPRERPFAHEALAHRAFDGMRDVASDDLRRMTEPPPLALPPLALALPPPQRLPQYAPTPPVDDERTRRRRQKTQKTTSVEVA